MNCYLLHVQRDLVVRVYTIEDRGHNGYFLNLFVYFRPARKTYTGILDII